MSETILRNMLRGKRLRQAGLCIVLCSLVVGHFLFRGSARSLDTSNEGTLDWKGRFTGRLDLGPQHTVDLSESSLSTLPPGFVEWAKGRVHTLYLSGNELNEIPDLSSLHGLRMLSLRKNALTVLNCDRLPNSIYHLIVTDNQIREFKGDCTARLAGLNKLMMARNQLASFPDSLRLPNLELIRLPQNRLQTLPRQLLKSSPKLKWASFAENPCCPEPDISLPDLGAIECETGSVLGGGTSGTAILCKGSKTVFKKFKASSSDGSAAAELAISSLLPKDNLAVLAPIGVATLESDGSKGVLFPLKRAKPVGLPPQFGSEDRFPPEKQKRFHAVRVLEAMRQAACALSRIHDSGVVHMDLYAHNTLLSESEIVILDFGAATCIKYLSKEDAILLIKLDTRAFAKLVHDLTANVVDDVDIDRISIAELHKLVADSARADSVSQVCPSSFNEQSGRK